MHILYITRKLVIIDESYCSGEDSLITIQFSWTVRHGQMTFCVTMMNDPHIQINIAELHHKQYHTITTDYPCIQINIAELHHKQYHMITTDDPCIQINAAELHHKQYHMITTDDPCIQINTAELHHKQYTRDCRLSYDENPESLSYLGLNRYRVVTDQ